MANTFFQFKQFTVHQDRCAMKVTTDGCLFGAWVGEKARSPESGVRRFLDIGTGTGLLSLMLAQKFPSAEIDAIEIDEAAAKQARENADASPWKETVFVMPGDAKDMAFALGNEYDIIISNPPFYETELTSPDSQKNMAHHGAGLLLEDLLQIITGVLSPTGRFYLLLPYKRFLEAGLLFHKYQLVITHTTLVRQTPRHDPFRFFVEGQPATNNKAIYQKDELFIKNKDDQYSQEFQQLLKDYYLHL